MEGVAVLIKCPNCGRAEEILITASSTGEQVCSNCGHLVFTFRPILGYIYVLSNPKMLGLLKVGFTLRPVDDRVQELSSATGVPTPFIIEAFFPSFTPVQDEQKVFQVLGTHRLKDREFFKVGLEEAVSKIEATLKSAPLYRRTEPRLTNRPSVERAEGSLNLSMYCGLCKYEWTVKASLNPVSCPKCHSESIGVLRKS